VVTCKEKSNHKSQLILVVFLCFQICFFLSSSTLPNLELGVTRAADDRPGVWMAGSATSLFLLHFYTGGVVHRCHGWEIGTLESRFSAPFYCSSASLLISSSSLQ